MARPRSARAHKQVLDAALELFAERGIESTSMDSIAGLSRVSKATIYKHWADKDALCLEAMVHLHGLDKQPPLFESGDLRADLIAFLKYRPAEERPELHNRLMPHLIAYSAHNRAFGNAWRSRFMEPSRAQISKLLNEAIETGELSRDLNISVGVAMIMGPMLYRHIFSGIHGDVPQDLPELVVNALWKAYRAAKPARNAARNN